LDSTISCGLAVVFAQVGFFFALFPESLPGLQGIHGHFVMERVRGSVRGGLVDLREIFRLAEAVGDEGKVYAIGWNC
jgi:hypothetical protein